MQPFAPLNLLAVAFGASVGAVLRYAVSLWAAARWGAGFPAGTLLINVLGSLVIGVVLELAARVRLAEPVRLLIVTGLLGGFTTFSTFSYETYALVAEGRWQAAAAYVAASVVLGLGAAVLGVGLARLLAPA
jgi:fluoride exporter